MAALEFSNFFLHFLSPSSLPHSLSRLYLFLCDFLNFLEIVSDHDHRKSRRLERQSEVEERWDDETTKRDEIYFQLFLFFYRKMTNLKFQFQHRNTQHNVTIFYDFVEFLSFSYTQKDRKKPFLTKDILSMPLSYFIFLAHFFYSYFSRMKKISSWKGSLSEMYFFFTKKQYITMRM